MRSQYTKYLDKHRISDGVLREILRTDQPPATSIILQDIDHAIESRKRDIEVLEKLKLHFEKGDPL